MSTQWDVQKDARSFEIFPFKRGWIEFFRESLRSCRCFSKAGWHKFPATNPFAHRGWMTRIPSHRRFGTTRCHDHCKVNDVEFCRSWMSTISAQIRFLGTILTTTWMGATCKEPWARAISSPFSTWLMPWGECKRGFKWCTGHSICSWQFNYFASCEGSFRIKSALLCTSQWELPSGKLT